MAWSSSGTRSFVLRVLLVAAVYFGSAKLGLALAHAQGNVTAIWPPTGIALAALVVWGYRFWPGVALGALLANATTDVPLLTTLGIATGNTLEALTGAALLSRFDFRPSLERIRDVVVLILCAGVVSTAVSATIGNLSLLLGGQIYAARFGFFWRLWWLGDMGGDFLVAPIILLLATPVVWLELVRSRAREAVALTAAIVALAVFSLTPTTPVAFLVFPGLVIAALRFRQIGAAVASLLVAFVAVWITARGGGPFGGGSKDDNLLASQLFCGVGALTALLLAAAVAERKRAEDTQRFLAETLQRSLLPDRLPQIAGVDFAARYLPGGAGVDVGGDWYDATQSVDGTVNLVIGDVAGRGVRAAAIMGQLRTAARAYTLEGSPPAEILTKLNQLAHAAGLGAMATALCVAYDPVTGGLRIANAGHPPPLIVEPGGAVRRLETARALPLNVDPHAHYDETEGQLKPGNSLLLYTDGLIERKDERLLQGIERLERAAAEAPSGAGPLCDHVAERTLGETELSDDVALLAFHALAARSEPLQLRVPARPEVVAQIRHSLRRWLVRSGATAEEIDLVVLSAGEACSNAIEHAYGPGDAELELAARVDAGVLELIVKDFGRWRPPRGQHRGRGLEIMRSTMDDVAVNHDDDGTVVRMSRRLANAAQDPPQDTTTPPSATSPLQPSRDLATTPILGGATLRLRHDHDIVMAGVDGEVDMANARDVFGRIGAALDNSALGLVLDLSATSYLDSSGLQGLLDLRRRLQVRGQQLRVVSPDDGMPRPLLEMVNGQGSMPVHRSVADALAAFEPRATA